MSVPTVRSRKRLILFLVIIALTLVILSGRLGYIQLVWGRELQNKAYNQWTRSLDVYPQRGTIYDRSGTVVLAQSASSDSIAIRPGQILDARDTSEKLAAILDLDAEELYNKISNENQSEVWIKRQITRGEANRVRELNIKGVYFTEEPRRYYPNGNLASHLLGFTMRYSEPGEGLKGQEGIELYYDKYLKGVPGNIMVETDRDGRETPTNVERLIPAIDGWNAILTVDQTIQYFVEKAVADAMDNYQAKKIYAVVMDPKTGEVLAMANRPDFDPNEPPRQLGFEGMQEFIKNISVKDNMDPGSTFKIITTASALEEGVATIHSTYHDPGYRMVDGVRIRCWKAGGHGTQNLSEVVQNSCNPAFMDMALGLGRERFYDYLEAFGFGQKTGIDISGEEKGVLMNEASVKNVDLARMGFGQAISVTPMQLVSGISAAINGGNLMQPHLVKALEFDDGEKRVYEEIRPTVVRRVVSEETSAIMRDILLNVVNEGSGKNAYIPGYRVAGKTGTAQKYKATGGIDQGNVISSFVGFAPADDPQVIVLFMVDEPQVAVDFGSVVAAPYVKMIMEDTLKYLGVEPIFDEETETHMRKVNVPDITGMPLIEATRDLQAAGLQYLSEDTGTTVIDQMPKPGAEVMVNTTVLLYMDKEGEGAGENSGESNQGDKVAVPDLANRSIREASSILTNMGLKLRIEGSGIAVGQNPPAGTMVDPGSEIEVRFELPE
ncbi:MAG TPA: penicillin-binding transpeptidase domain-containing protein [Bacillota bacterium]|nr:penicillin-binding transpeptidase domain-containing protein [Bacillota bacterium]